jgi:hypothetical protein
LQFPTSKFFEPFKVYIAIALSDLSKINLFWAFIFTSHNSFQIALKRLLISFTFFLFQLSLFAQVPLQVFDVDQRLITVTGSATGFLPGDRVASGTQGLDWAFVQSMDTFYLAHFAPENNPSSEPYLLYIKSYYSVATFTTSPQDYDGFSPNFSAVGGINFVAYIKNNYDEFRSWNGTTWSSPNTSMEPRFRSTPTAGSRMACGIPWSAITNGNGIPDSIRIVAYRTNGNAGGIFSYAQLPQNQVAGSNGSPAITAMYRWVTKRFYSLSRPFHFGKVGVGTSAEREILLFNPNATAASFSGNQSISPDSIFSISVQAQGTIAPKSYRSMTIKFEPNVILASYQATVSVPNSTTTNPIAFRVVGTGGGEPNISASIDGTPITSSGVDFGENIPENQAVIKNVILNSSGTDTAFVSPFIYSNPTNFSLVSISKNALAPGDTALLRLRFNGAGEGSYTGKVFIMSLEGESSIRYDLSASVVPLSPPDMEITLDGNALTDGDSLSFPDRQIGSFADTLISIRNIGMDTLRITSVPVSGPGFSVLTNLPLKIGANASATIRVRFTGTAPAGIKLGEITLNSNDPDISSFKINLKGRTLPNADPQSVLEIRHVANNLINTSGAIPPGQLLPKLLLSDNAGIKWYAAWDSSHLYILKYGGNRTQPQLIYLRAAFPGAVFTDTPTNYDGFSPNFTGMGGINFAAYLKETTIPYDEFRTWNGTLWSAPNTGLQPLYGNQGLDEFAVRIPWNDITQGNGIADSLRIVLYQINGPAGANFTAYAQSPVGLPSGNVVTPPIGLSHNRKILTRLAPNAEFDFGNVVAGTSVDTTFLLQNEGDPGSVIQINGPVTLTGPSYSVVSQVPTGAQIAAKNQRAVKIRFSPSAVGDFTGDMTVNASYNQPGPNYKIRFKGKGVAAPQAGILVKLRGQSFGDNSTIPVGLAEIGTAFDTAVYIVNNGQSPLLLNGLGVISSGWTITGFPSLNIPPGDSSKISVRRLITLAGSDTGKFSMGTNIAGQPFFRFGLLLQGDSVLSWTPSFPSIYDSLTIRYNAAFGNKVLAAVNPVYVHTGVITSGPTGTVWQNVQGNFNQPADSVKLSNSGGGIHFLKIKIKDFYNLTGNPTVYRLGMVFRNANGSLVGKTRADGDFFIPVNPNAGGAIRLSAGNNQVLTNNSTIVFGTLPVGSIRDTVLKLKNQGPGIVNFSVFNLSGLAYTLTSQAPVLLPAGDSVSISIRLNVQGPGLQLGLLNLQSNATNFPSFQVRVTANGVVSNAVRLQNVPWVLFPNPASTRLHIAGEFSGTASFVWMDCHGKELEKGQLPESKTLDVAALPKGMYILRLSDGTKSQNLRFMRE